MTAKQMLQLLWARRKTFSWVFLGVVVLAMGITLVWPKTYTSEVSVVIDSKSTDPVSGMEKASDMLPSYVATQADVIMSHNVALKVVEKLHMASNPILLDAFKEATDGAGSIKDWLADLLLYHVEIKPSKESHVLNIDVSYADPEAAAAIANAFADAYIQTSMELKTEPARRQTAWFQDQIQELKKSLEATQVKLTDYQRSHTVVGTNDQIDIENARLAELSNQLLAAQNAGYEAQSHLKQMKQATERDELNALPDVLANSLVQSMKADLSRAESQLAETTERYGKNHPQYISASAEVKALREKIQAEVKSATIAIEQSAQQDAAQVVALSHALDQQRDHILQLKREHDELDVLKRDVDGAQRVYDAALLRSTQVRLESQLDQSNIAILNPAVPPLHSSKPKVLLNLLVSIVGGFILGLGVALGAEHLDHRIRTAVDLTELTSLPVLAEIPLTPRRKSRRRLIGFKERSFAVQAR